MLTGDDSSSSSSSRPRSACLRSPSNGFVSNLALMPHVLLWYTRGGTTVGALHAGEEEEGERWEANPVLEPVNKGS